MLTSKVARVGAHSAPTFTTLCSTALLAAAAVGGARLGLRHAPSAGDAFPGPVAAAVAAQAVVPGPAYAAPVLNFLGEDDVCESWIGTQNVGAAASVVLLVSMSTYDGRSSDPGINRPTQVECSGLIRPGSGWSFLGAQVPTGSRAGVLLSVTASPQPGALGPDGDADLPAGRLCERLDDALENGPTAWVAFWAAWWSGSDWAGLPLGRMGGSPLAIEVHRSCPGFDRPGEDVTSAFRAVTLMAPSPGRYQATVAHLGTAERLSTSDDSLLYVLNTGLVTATFAVQLQEGPACAPDAPAASTTLAPGAQWAVSLAGLVRSAWSGSALLTGDGPFAVVHDRALHRSFMTEADIADRTGGPPDADTGALLFAPLLLDPGDNRVEVAMHNAGGVEAQPRLMLTGAAVPGLIAAICPGGTITRTFEVANPGPDPLAVVAVIQDGVRPSALTAEARVRWTGKTHGGTAYDARFAVAADPSPADAAAMGVIAVPIASNNLENSGLLTDLSVARAGGGVGELDVVVALYDANGLVERLCRTLDETTRAIDVQLGPNGAAQVGRDGVLTVSAAAWRPGTPGAGPGELSVLAMVRKGGVPGEDVPGDETAAMLGTVVTGADAAALRAEALAAPCGLVAEPPPSRTADGPADATAYVPVATFQGMDDVCHALVRVTNRGSTPTQLLAVTLDEPGFCAPNCRGPLDFLCSPLLGPGAAWIWDSSTQGGFGTSWVVMSLKPDALDELGIRAGEPRTAAEVICANEDLLDDCDTWRRLYAAWTLGGRFGGLPMDRLVGAPIEVSVGRTCPDAVNPNVSNTAVYAAPTGRDVAAGRTRPDRWVYNLGEVFASSDADGFSRQTLVYVQNAGLRCATVSMAFGADPARATLCKVHTLSPGEVYALDANDCVGPDFAGPLVLSSTEPLAIVADRIWPTMTQSNAVAGGAPCDVDADGDVGVDDWLAVEAAMGSAAGGPRWNPRADLDSNGWIDAADRERVTICLPAGVPTPTTVALPTRPTQPTATPWMDDGRSTATATPHATATARATAASTGTATTRVIASTVHLPISFRQLR